MRRLVSNTGEVFTALSERQGQLSALITNSNTRVPDDGGQEPQLRRPSASCRHSRSSGRDADAARPFAHNANPLITQLRPAARELTPDADRAGQAGAGPQGAVPATSTRSSRRRRRASRPPRRSSTSCARCSASSTRSCASSTRSLDFLGALPQRADGVLRQHRRARRRPPTRRPTATARGSTTCARPTRSTPRPRRLSAPRRHEPAQPVHVPRRLRQPAPPGCSRSTRRATAAAACTPISPAAGARPASSSPLLGPPTLKTLIDQLVYNASTRRRSHGRGAAVQQAAASLPTQRRWAADRVPARRAAYAARPRSTAPRPAAGAAPVA